MAYLMVRVIGRWLRARRWLRNACEQLKAGVFGQAAYDVGTLDRLGRCAFSEVVDGAHAHGNLLFLVDRYVDVRAGRSFDRHGFGPHAFGKHGNQSFVGIVLFVERVKIAGCGLLREGNVDRGKKSAAKRCEMRRENDMHQAIVVKARMKAGVSLGYFGCMAMMGKPVRFNGFVRGAEVGLCRGFASGSGDAGYGIDDHGGCLLRKPCVHGGRGGEDGCRDVAAGAPYDDGIPLGVFFGEADELCAHGFGLAVHGVFEEFRRGVGGFVDALVTVLVGEAEVGGKVDDGNARFRKPLCMLHASGVGNGGKHYVAGKQRFVIMGYEGCLGIGVFKCWVKLAYFGARFGSCRKGDRLKDGMLRDQPGKLCSGESCCTDDSYAYGVHHGLRTPVYS